MADSKKAVTATAKPVAKAVAATTTETTNVKAEAIKETEKKAPVKKAAPAAKKPAAKKEAPVKKAAPAKKAAAAKAEVSTTVSFQFSGKEYKTEDLVKIAKDVWKYDLNKEVADFKTVELYVKPEECLVYYVINGDVTGNFAI